MQDRVSAILEELLDETTIEAFAKAWPADSQVAAAEAASIADILTRPNSEEFRSSIGHLVNGLVGSQPALLAWLRALDDEDGFELRRPSKRAKELPSPSRAIASAMSSVHTLEKRLKAGETSRYLDAKRERLRMLTAASLVHKLRDSVRAPAAIGPGWTLMHAVGERKNADLNRRLHQFGADAGFRDALAEAIEDAVSNWLARSYGDSPPPYARAADWKRSLPPGSDPVKYFSAEPVAAYRKALFSALEVELASTQEAIDPIIDAALIKSNPAVARQLEGSFSYRINETGERIESFEWSQRSIERLTVLLPLLQSGSETMMMAAAVRAFERAWARTQRRAAPLPNDPLEDEIHQWVDKGDPPPPHMRLQDAHLFEEEACFAYLEMAGDWSGLNCWRQLGFFPAEPSGAVDTISVRARYRKPAS